MHNTNTISWIKEKIKDKAYLLWVLLFIRALLSIISVGYAFLFKQIIEAATSYDNLLFKKSVIILLLCLFVQVVLQAINRYMTEYTTVNIENKLKSSFYNELIYKKYSNARKKHSGEWINYVTRDSRIVTNNIVEIIPGGISMLIRIISIIIMMLYLDVRFALFLLPLGIITFIFTLFIRNRMKELNKSVQKANGKLISFFQEHLDNLLTIKAYSKEEYSSYGSCELLDNVKEKRLNRIKYSSWLHLGYSLFMNGLYIFAAIYCSFSILNKTISIGSTVALLQLVSQIQAPFSNISSYVTRYYSLLASAERLQSIDQFENDYKQFISKDEVGELYNQLKSIELRNIDFAYDENNEKIVLNNVNLSFIKNTLVSIVGESGCGKSTVLKLLLDIYKPDNGCLSFICDSGTVSINGMYRGMFAYVSQKPDLFSGSVKDNILFGEEYEKNRFDNALYLSCCEDFVNELPEKELTPLGENGNGLSEGQLQRITIARAIYSDRPILLLDEATSAIDVVTKDKLINRIKELNNKTVICVTHDMSIAEISDKVILCFKHGDETVWEETK